MCMGWISGEPVGPNELSKSEQAIEHHGRHTGCSNHHVLSCMKKVRRPGDYWEPVHPEQEYNYIYHSARHVKQ